MRSILFLVACLLMSCKKERQYQQEIKTVNSIKISNDTIIPNYLKLPLEKKWTDSIINLPYKLKENEISVVIGISYGWLAFDEKNHYVYSNDSIVKHFKEKIPKSYLKKNKEKYSFKEVEMKFDLKSRLITNLYTKETLSFLNYDQENFRFKSNNFMLCKPTDMDTYSISFIQNNKIKSYWYYAPKYALAKCKDENINKKMLEQFIMLLENYDIKL